MIVHEGSGFVNKLINKLPFELHLPKFQYCGPGTKLAERLARGDPGINILDQACKEHDIVYSKTRELGPERKRADKVLADKAWERVKASDSGVGEKAAALLVNNVMKLKSKMGMGVKRCHKKKRKSKRGSGIKFSTITKAAKNHMKGGKFSDSVIKSALTGARAALKKAGGKRKVVFPRILPVSSRIGGALPFLIPLFAGLSATGALAGGAAGVAKAINEARAARDQLQESKRHNNTMEAIALGKGLYLKPYKTGLGLYLKPYPGYGLKKKKKRSS